MLDAFRQADQVLLQGVSGITELHHHPGPDQPRLRRRQEVMEDTGSALMGIGSARGDDRAIAAAEAAISSPLLEASIDGAHGVLLSISGGSDLGLFEVNEAAQLVADAAHPDANIIFGAVIDDTLGDEVRVTVIAAGFDGGLPPARRTGTKPVTTRDVDETPLAVDAARATAEAGPAGDHPGVAGRRAQARAAPDRLRRQRRRRRPRRARLPQVVRSFPWPRPRPDEGRGLGRCGPRSLTEWGRDPRRRNPRPPGALGVRRPHRPA